MPVRLIILNAASTAITEQAVYYEERQGAQLAGDWSRSVLTAIQSLRSAPHRGTPCRFDHPRLVGLRWVRVGRFPYLVFYKYEEPEGIARVVRVLHEKRDLEYLLLHP